MNYALLSRTLEVFQASTSFLFAKTGEISDSHGAKSNDTKKRKSKEETNFKHI